MQNIGILPRNLSFVAKPFNQEDVTAVRKPCRPKRKMGCFYKPRKVFKIFHYCAL